MKLSKIIASTALVLTLSAAAFADEAYDIMKKSTTLDAPETSEAVMNLDNIETNGTVDHRIMYQRGRKINGLTNVVFDFTQPASVRNTRVLQSEKNARDDDRWIYMPQLKQVRRIPMAERYKNFVGCEFTYNDMAIRKVDEDTHEMISENETVTNAGKTYKCWKIKSTPVKKSEVEYSYKINYIDKETYLPAKMEYFDKKDPTKLLKTYTTEDWIYFTAPKSGKTYALRLKARMTNNVTGRQTFIFIEKPKFDEGISPNYFTQQFLQTGKAK